MAAPVAAPPGVAPPAETPAFGIENAVGLMKALPLDENPELVLRIVRKTLRSSGVSVEDVVGSARSREMKLSASIREENDAIDHLERQIAARRADIERLSETLNETRDARLRLEEALETESKVGLAVPPPEVVARLRAEAASKPPPPVARPLSKPPPSAAPAKPRTLPKPPVPLPSRAPPNAGPPVPPPPASSSKPPLATTSPKPPAVAPSPAVTPSPGVAAPSSGTPPSAETPPSSGTPATAPSPTGLPAPAPKESRHELPSISGWDTPPSEPTVRVAVPVRDDSTDERDD